MSEAGSGAKLHCLKAIADRIAATEPDRETAAIQINVAAMNRFNALYTAEIPWVA
jgi:hypothetical protein